MGNKDKQEKDVRNVNESIVDQNEKVLNPDILVQKYMKETYTDSFSEETKQQNEELMEKLGENIKYVERLEGTQYNFTSKGFGYINPKEDPEENPIYLVSNTFVVPVKKYNLKSEEEVKSSIEMKGFIAPTGEELPSIIVPIKEFEGGRWFTNDLWGLKVKFELPIQKNIQLNCIKDLSKYMEEETIYQFIGFTKIHGKKVFLHIGGAIGIKDKIKVDLEDEVLNKFSLTNKNFNIKNTLKFSLKFLDVAPKKITLPILALIFMSPLTSTFEELGIAIGFLTWVLGPQQCKKTSMVSAGCSHFGNFNKNQAPMSFLDGIPSAREKSAKLKDVLTLCDDYFPTSNKQEAAEMKKFTEKLISSISDGITGSRSKSNGKMRKTYRAKGQIITTGELFPDLSQSRMSRVLFINVTKGDIQGKELKNIQDHQEELQYTMKKYIEYIIENFEKIKSEIQKMFDTKKDEAGKEVTDRTAEMLSGLYIGYKTLMDFAYENGVITADEKGEMLKEGWSILVDLGKEQNMMVENISPIKMFLSGIEVLVNTGRLSTFEYDSAKHTKIKEIAKDGFIGFYDKSNQINLVYPDLLYKEIKNFYNGQDIEFPWDKSTMCKELFNQGYLYKTEKQERPQIRRLNPHTKQEETFIGLLSNKVYIPYRYNDNGNILTK